MPGGQDADVAAAQPLGVACANGACAVKGVERQVTLPQVGPGILARPTLLCASCGHMVLVATEALPLGSGGGFCRGE